MCTEFVPKWRPKTKMAVFILFFYKNSTQMPPITLLWNLFLMQISWQLSVASEKADLRFLDLTKWLQNPKWRPKSIFSYFCSQSYILYPISKIFFAFKASVHYLTFMEKIQNGGIFQDGVIFEKKSTFRREGLSHPKLNFFQKPKTSFCSAKTQDIPKKFAKKNFTKWRKYPRWRLCIFFILNCPYLAFFSVYRADFWTASLMFV